MPKSTLSSSSRSHRARKIRSKATASTTNHMSSRSRRSNESSDVLISAVISTYLLTHLHHVLQRAEFGALKEGRSSQAANFAQLRKVLCMDARSMQDASASGLPDGDLEKLQNNTIESKVA